MENKAQQKIPVLFTSICGNELYLVNNMDFKLLKIKVTSSRTTGCSLVTSSEKMLFNVKPRSIVKIDEFDQIVDSD